MYCILWVIFQSLALVVESDVSSGSAEALANRGANNNGGPGAAKGANIGAQNGVPLIGEPFVAQIAQVGSSIFIQPLGNPVGQAPLQQLIPVAVLQQGGALLMGQAGGATMKLQGLATQQAGGGPVNVFAVLPQGNVGGVPQGVMLTPGQVQLMSVVGQNNQQPLGGVGGAANPSGRVRFQRSVAARLRRMQSPPVKTMATEDEEECSGVETEEKQVE